MLPDEECIEAAYGGQTPANASRRQPTGMRVRGEAPYVLGVEPPPAGDSLAVTELHERGEIERVVGIGRGGKPPLSDHITAKLSDGLERGRRHEWLPDAQHVSSARP